MVVGVADLNASENVLVVSINHSIRLPNRRDIYGWASVYEARLNLQ